MGLFARWTAQDNTKIDVHRWGSAIRQFASSQLTQQQIIDTFALDAATQVELQALINTYNALGTGSAAAVFVKARYLGAMEDVAILCEKGDYTEAKAKAALGF